MSPPTGPPDRAATFASFYEQAYPDVLRFVQRRVHPSHAEDVVADTFLVVWRRFDDVPDTLGGARAWTFGIARHVLLNERRGSDRRRALGVRVQDVGTVLGIPGATADPGGDVAGRVDLARAWGRLSELHQETLGLAVLDDLTSAQAAQVLDISPVAFRLRLARARRALRAHLSTATSSLHPDLASPTSDRTACHAPRD